MINVLVVDDSSFMRHALVKLLEADPEIKVVATARNGVEAIEQASKLDADVMTLDVEMPGMNGLDALRDLMKTHPMPVIMVSSLTEAGAVSTLKALEYGALDFIPKSLSTSQESFGEELRRKVKTLSRRKGILKLKYSRVNRPAETATRQPARPRDATVSLSQPLERKTTPKLSMIQSASRGARDLVVIGVSTGGPPVVQKILAALPGNLPACVLIAQHMPASFTGPFARRLDGISAFKVTEACDGDKLQHGRAYICPGGKHIGVRMHGPLGEVAITDEPRNALYKPTVNVLMETAGMCMGRHTLGVMLTGMGSDGVDGARVLRQKGGYLIAQSEASCVVYGMPKAVIDAGLANQILDVDDIAQAIIASVKG